MTDTTAGETPAEPAPPNLAEISARSAPEATAELEAAAPQASEAVASADPSAERALPNVEHLGVLRRAVLDALLDADEPLSVSRILAEMPPGTTRGSAESAVRREWEAGRIERVAPGVYGLAPPKPPEPPKPTPQPPPTPTEEAIWFEALERWVVDRSSWDVEKFGPPPDAPNNNIQPAVKLRFNDRLRKREERRREAEAAAARQGAADAELRDRLIAATGGNIVRSSAVDDVAPIKLALQVVPLERILSAIRSKTDRKLYPKNEPAASWGEPRLLKAIAESYCAAVIVPSLVKAWGEAGKAPATTTRASSPPAGDMPDDNIDRSHHDHEHAPPGPHSLSKSPMDEDADAVPSVVPDVPANAADASEAPTAVSVPPV